MSKWNVLKDANGNAISAGFTSFTPTGGQTVVAYDDVDSTVLAEIKKGQADTEDAKSAPYDAKVADETITLPNLVKLLKAKGII